MAKKTLQLAGDATVGRNALTAIAANLNGQYGTDFMGTLDAVDYVHRKKLPFGIFTLDYATQGGVPISHYTRLWGPKSTFKTTTCLRLLGQAQKVCRHCKDPIVEYTDENGELVKDCNCPNPRWSIKGNSLLYAWLSVKDARSIIRGCLPEKCKSSGKGKAKRYFVEGKCPERAKDYVTNAASGTEAKIYFEETIRCEPMRTLYVDTDRTADISWVKANNVDPSLVMVLGAAWGEQAFDYLEQLLETGEIDLIVIDSLSGLTPKKLLETDPEKNEKIAASATFLKKLFKRFNMHRHKEGLSSRYVPTIVCTSQVSMHGIGGSIPPWMAPSGTDSNSEHAFSLDIKMQAKSYHKINETIADYADFGFLIKKNKVGGSPEAEGIVRFQLVETKDKKVGDCDDSKTVMNLARELLIIYSGKGAANKLVFDSKFSVEGKYAFAKVGDCQQFLRENETIYMDLRSRVVTAMFDNAGVKLPTLEEVEGSVKVYDSESAPKAKKAMTVQGLEVDMLQDDDDEEIEVTGLMAKETEPEPEPESEPEPEVKAKNKKPSKVKKTKKENKVEVPEGEDSLDMDNFAAELNDE